MQEIEELIGRIDGKPLRCGVYVRSKRMRAVNAPLSGNPLGLHPVHGGNNEDCFNELVNAIRAVDAELAYGAYPGFLFREREALGINRFSTELEDRIHRSGFREGMRYALSVFRERFPPGESFEVLEDERG